MTNETLKEEYLKWANKNMSLAIISSEVANWWISRLAERDALLLKKLKEMKQNPNKEDGWGQFELGVLQTYDKALEDIKLLINNI